MWKVVGYMEPPSGHSRAAGGEIHGPLPCKVWTGPHSVKGYRRRKPKMRVSPSRDASERHAYEYAAWLCQRDGREVPKGLHHSRIVWGSVEIGTHTRKRRWGGTQEISVTHARVQAIEWGHMREVHNERKDGKQGAWLYNEFVPEFRVDFPNWDFNPAEPQEEIVDDEADAIMAAYVAIIDQAA